MSSRVAVFPMSCKAFSVSKNLHRAEKGVRQAADRGAEIVLLPELFSIGYCYDQRIFETAEAREGTTVRWMSRVSQQYGITVVGTFVERAPGFICNTLAMVDPHGQVAFYRKRSLPIFERLYFRAGKEAGIVSSSIGRIGFLICWDITSDRVISELAGRIDLLLICGAWPDLSRGNYPLIGLGAALTKLKRNKPAEIARRLRVPTAVCNMSGTFRTHVPLTPLRYRTGFVRSASGVCDANGKWLGRARANQAFVTDVSTTSVAPVPRRAAG